MIEFGIKKGDLKQAIKELRVNRENPADPALIHITTKVAEFRAAGTQTSVGAEGRKMGTMRVPFSVLEKVQHGLDTFRAQEVEVVVDTGVLKVNGWSVKNREIEKARAPRRDLNIPIDLPILETVALGRMFSAERLSEQGLGERVKQAEETYSQVVESAVAGMRQLSIPERDVRAFAHRYVRDAVVRVKKGLDG